jgi:hypothetical protein
VNKLTIRQYIATAVEARAMAFVAARWGRWTPRRYLAIAITAYAAAVVWLAAGITAIVLLGR